MDALILAAKLEAHYHTSRSIGRASYLHWARTWAKWTGKSVAEWIDLRAMR